MYLMYLISADWMLDLDCRDAVLLGHCLRGRGSHKIGIVFYGKHARNVVVKQKTLLWLRSLRHTQYKDLDTHASKDTDTDS